MTSAVARSNAAKARTSLVMSASWEPSSDNTASESTDDVGNRVKISEEPEIKVMSPVSDSDDGFPVIDRSSSPISVASVASSVSSELSAAPVAKVLASRLSFWSKSLKKNSVNTPDVESPRVSVDEEDARPLDALIHEDMPEERVVMGAHFSARFQKTHAIKKKVVKIHGVQNFQLILILRISGSGGNPAPRATDPRTTRQA